MVFIVTSYTGTEITTPKETLLKQESPDPAKPEVEAVAQQVAQVNIGITPAENPEQVS